MNETFMVINYDSGLECVYSLFMSHVTISDSGSYVSLVNDILAVF